MYDPDSIGPEAIEIVRQLRASTPLKRLGYPEEVANVIRFLLLMRAIFQERRS